MDAVHDDLVSLIFYRRHNIQRTAREVNKRRRSDLKDYSFPDIVFIATFGGLSDIPKYNPTLVQQARIRNKEFSFFDYWQKYCKALLDPERTLAIYEGAIFLGGEALPRNEVEQWHEQHQETLLRIQQIGEAAPCSPQPVSSTPEEPRAQDNGRPSKRRRVGGAGIRFRDFKPPNDRVSPMHVAARDRLTTILSDVLWEGLQSSQVWAAERQQSLTQALCLFWPDNPGDFVLDLVVTESCAKSVSEAAKQPGDALRSVLGDFLFKAMKASDCIKDGGKFVDAVTTLDYEDEDKIVRIFLGFAEGWEASSVFPTTD
ncbi:hypothetical protein BHE90_010893 [Fusarium euwallaceae]|uniref:Uncharacterized protein n=2 Tax=Fusarium solani species complex TaxID=232080 RepID=A0A3M2S4F6_9HYPO|nr:hypothetical protein CDV36_007894 [Fusarium kuroshium]RTE74664.1 hypothetical protein BHE90_010893 [Fusarium euwallaceae]